MAKKPDPRALELEAMLRSEVRRDRPSGARILLAGALVLLAPVVLLIWWFWPQPDPPGLSVTAFDQVALANTPVTLTAVVRPRPNAEGEARLGGWPVIFQEVLLGPPRAEPPFRHDARTDAEGVATTDVELPPPVAVADFQARYAPPGKTRPAEDRARVFAWPAGSRVLLVDAEGSLTTADLSGWKAINANNLPRVSGAARALPDVVRGVEGIRLVYLACSVQRPEEYRRVRGWVQAIPADDTPRLPDGPVLGRLSYDGSAGASEALRQRVRSLREVFGDACVGVTASPATATAFREAGCTTLLIGEHQDVPDGTSVLKTWEELPAALERGAES